MCRKTYILPAYRNRLQSVGRDIIFGNDQLKGFAPYILYNFVTNLSILTGWGFACYINKLFCLYFIVVSCFLCDTCFILKKSYSRKEILSLVLHHTFYVTLFLVSCVTYSKFHVKEKSGLNMHEARHVSFISIFLFWYVRTLLISILYL